MKLSSSKKYSGKEESERETFRRQKKKKARHQQDADRIAEKQGRSASGQRSGGRHNKNV